MFCCLTVSTARALLCMTDAEFRIQVIIEAVVACPEPEHLSFVPVWLRGSMGQSCCTVVLTSTGGSFLRNILISPLCM